MPRVVHFEYPMKDPDKMKIFYSEVFDWKIDKWGGPVECWLVMTGPDQEPGINGAFTRETDLVPKNTVLTIRVPSVDLYTEKVRNAGGTVIREKLPIPGVG